MDRSEQNPTAAPWFSVVIPVYNDWIPLEQCLQTLARQREAPSFEVIVVDDGSAEVAPEFIARSAQTFPFTVIRRPHGGIPAARNHGILNSRGSVLLFVDADCRLRENCLSTLERAISRSPQHDYFQLRLVGNSSTVVGRAEELRLTTFQEHMLQRDGRILYLNTAGFAMRRRRADLETGVFDPKALRAEDTLLLAHLMERGELPFFVADAVVEHVILLSLLDCFRKDIRSVYLEGPTYEVIAAKGVRIRVTHRERVRLLRSMWKTAGERSLGRSAWFVLVARQALQRVSSFVCRALRAASP
jgi:glycosyltransferase involved in cell wall biosynthesis